MEPPPAPPLPAAGARYPLFADDFSDTAPRGLAVAAREAPAPRPAHQPRRLPGGALRYLLLGCGLVLAVAGAGLWLLLRPGGAPMRAVLPDVPPPASATTWRDLTESATASAPMTDAPAVDTAGHPTTYDAANLLDHDTATAWRMAGDGTGQELTFTFDAPVTLTEVGLVNGYAKTGHEGGRELNWYEGNRRVLKVAWVLDDGTTIPQDLRTTRDLQTVPVPGLSTTSVTLRLLEVSAPGHGPAARDKTAISDVTFAGR